MIEKKIGIVIPARNEEESLAEVLDNLPLSDPSMEMKVFVVDDCSEDGTYKVARERSVEVVRHSVALGVGGALKTGYLMAKEWGADVIVQLDADGEHDPKELDGILQPVLDRKADMVIGSRFINGSPLPLSLTRRIGIRFFSWFLNKLSGYELTDLTSGYRAFRGEILDKVMFPSEKHWAVEMALLASKNKLTLVEVPITPLKRRSGKSQFHEIMTFILYPLRAIRQIIDVYL
jgi:glycosyltransferase involved in cell wall biosynthesis